MSDGDGSGSVADKVLDAAGDVGGGIWGEIKKFGQSAGGQLSGHQSTVLGNATLSAKLSSPKTGQIPKPSDSGRHTVGDEVKLFGQDIIGQITGYQPKPEENLKKLQKADKDFSKQGEAQVQAKIKQIYAEYEAKRQREKQQEEAMKAQEEQLDEQKKAIEEKQKKEEFINPAIAKTRAENKNYGAE